MNVPFSKWCVFEFPPSAIALCWSGWEWRECPGCSQDYHWTSQTVQAFLLSGGQWHSFAGKINDCLAEVCLIKLISFSCCAWFICSDHQALAVCQDHIQWPPKDNGKWLPHSATFAAAAVRGKAGLDGYWGGPWVGFVLCQCSLDCFVVTIILISSSHSSSSIAVVSCVIVAMQNNALEPVAPEAAESGESAKTSVTKICIIHTFLYFRTELKRNTVIHLLSSKFSWKFVWKNC